MVPPGELVTQVTSNLPLFQLYILPNKPCFYKTPSYQLYHNLSFSEVSVRRSSSLHGAMVQRRELLRISAEAVEPRRKRWHESVRPDRCRFAGRGAGAAGMKWRVKYKHTQKKGNTSACAPSCVCFVNFCQIFFFPSMFSLALNLVVMTSEPYSRPPTT